VLARLSVALIPSYLLARLRALSVHLLILRLEEGHEVVLRDLLPVDLGDDLGDVLRVRFAVLPGAVLPGAVGTGRLLGRGRGLLRFPLVDHASARGQSDLGVDYVLDQQATRSS